ncbi:hypothetical protein [Alkalihalobacillus sp. TS-13]|uniref:hypothetical protein n=1 Tax=Alkalihalobacillus sp. TS-13 TaxID=2842455 RepID=UPI001C87CE12|nr:hypothetical protein [Alkalihalobacillus sp. TS-13]
MANLITKNVINVNEIRNESANGNAPVLFLCQLINRLLVNGYYKYCDTRIKRGDIEIGARVKLKSYKVRNVPLADFLIVVTNFNVGEHYKKNLLTAFDT